MFSAIEYPSDMRITRVQWHGDVSYRGRRIFLTESLSDEYIGIEQISDDQSLIWYCNYLLGSIDHQQWTIRPAKNSPLLFAARCEQKPT